MASTHEEFVGQLADALKEVCDFRIQQIEEIFKSRVAEFEMQIRHRDRRIEDLQELLRMRDAGVASLMNSLKECHSRIDQLQNDKKLLIKEKEVLKQRVAELEHRPEPLPCGLPELTRAALDQVRKWDADTRVEEQRKLVAALQKQLESCDNATQTLQMDNKNLTESLGHAEDQIREMRQGRDLRMCDVWQGAMNAEMVSTFVVWPWQRSTRTLYDFLANIPHELLKKDHEDYEVRQEEEDDDMEESSVEED